ncbi:MAG: hypothetical protein PHR19_08400 [Bacteroidales bacterium]|nr:hypothetical protein [Bacteroidales bacterium]
MEAEVLEIYEWNKNHSLKIVIESSLGSIIVGQLKYNKKGDIYYFPKNNSSAGFALDKKDDIEVCREFCDSDHNYISFHASGRIKGPDYESRNDGYAAFDFRIDDLDKPRELFELLPTLPVCYKVFEESDYTRAEICSLPSPSNGEGCTPRIYFDIVDTNHLKNAKIFKWEKKYYQGFILKNFIAEAGSNIVLLIGVEFMKMAIPQHNLIKVNL